MAQPPTRYGFLTTTPASPQATKHGLAQGKEIDFKKGLADALQKLAAAHLAKGHLDIWGVSMGYPQNAWFIMGNPIKIDDLGVTVVQETTI